MELFIDTSETEKVIVELDKTRIVRRKTKKGSQQLLSIIANLLEKKGKDIRDLKKIKINVGPGSFTGLRVGVSVANALSWSLGIPVNGKLANKMQFVKIKYKS